MKSQGLESPDIADAVAVTFYQQSMKQMRKVIAHKIIIPNATAWS